MGPLFLALSLSCSALEFTERETAYLHRALRALNATESDLGFQKDVGEPRSALRWIRDALHEPLALNRAGQALWDAANDPYPDALWTRAAAMLEKDFTETAPAVGTPFACEACPPAFAPAIAAFVRESQRAAALLDQAFASLSREEKDMLTVGALGGALRVEHDLAARSALEAVGIAPARVDTFIEEDNALDARPAAERFLDAAEKFDLGTLLSAGRVFYRAANALADAAVKIESWPERTLQLDTPLGPIFVLGPEVAVFSNAALAVIAPVGDRRFSGAAGVANGLRGQRLAAIIDLAGNDVYHATDLFGAASALFGLSVVIDIAGDDVWRANHAGPAVGVWGVAWLEDRVGRDLYESRLLGQGAAIAGFGALIDHDGHDSYGIGWMGQGFAGWRGFGLLLDRGGNDRYFAGGVEPDHERNPDRFMSLAQGSAIGMRPFAGGGVGALIDLAGNDRYLADVYGQGASYYYGAGFLLDGAGHDRYDVHHYGQGCGIHLSLGLMVDLDGDDRYIGGILAQGAAHDFAVGGLLDRGGDDTYVASQHVQGHGMNNALGWLLDAAGDDVYEGRDPAVTQGVGNTGGARDSGSIGLLLDLGGRDRYSSGVSDGRVTVRPLYGVVLDAVEENDP